MKPSEKRTLAAMDRLGYISVLKLQFRDIIGSKAATRPALLSLCKKGICRREDFYDSSGQLWEWYGRSECFELPRWAAARVPSSASANE